MAENNFGANASIASPFLLTPAPLPYPQDFYCDHEEQSYCYGKRQHHLYKDDLNNDYFCIESCNYAERYCKENFVEMGYRWHCDNFCLDFDQNCENVEAREEHFFHNSVCSIEFLIFFSLQIFLVVFIPAFLFREQSHVSCVQK